MTLEERITALENRVAELERQVGIPPQLGVSRYSRLVLPLGGRETKTEVGASWEEMRRMLKDEEEDAKMETQEEQLARLGLELPTHKKTAKLE